jgi:hypothetical protein
LHVPALVQLFPLTTLFASKFAVTVTALAGMMNVVAALFAFAKVTPLLAVVQFLKTLFPLGAVPAFMLTVAPTA